MKEYNFHENVADTYPHKKDTFFVSFLINLGIAKNKEQAVYVLLAIAGLGILFTIYMTINITGGEEIPDRYNYNEEEYDRALDPKESY